MKRFFTFKTAMWLGWGMVWGLIFGVSYWFVIIVFGYGMIRLSDETEMGGQYRKWKRDRLGKDDSYLSVRKINWLLKEAECDDNYKAMIVKIDDEIGLIMNKIVAIRVKKNEYDIEVDGERVDRFTSFVSWAKIRWDYGESRELKSIIEEFFMKMEEDLTGTKKYKGKRNQNEIDRNKKKIEDKLKILEKDLL